MGADQYRNTGTENKCARVRESSSGCRRLVERLGSHVGTQLEASISINGGTGSRRQVADCRVDSLEDWCAKLIPQDKRESAQFVMQGDDLNGLRRPANHRPHGLAVKHQLNRKMLPQGSRIALRQPARFIVEDFPFTFWRKEQAIERAGDHRRSVGHRSGDRPAEQKVDLPKTASGSPHFVPQLALDKRVHAANHNLWIERVDTACRKTLEHRLHAGCDHVRIDLCIARQSLDYAMDE